MHGHSCTPYFRKFSQRTIGWLFSITLSSTTQVSFFTVLLAMSSPPADPFYPWSRLRIFSFSSITETLSKRVKLSTAQKSLWKERQKVRKAIQLSRNIWFSDLDLRRLVKKLEPLTVGHYPVLNQYPKFVVDYRKRETDKIRKREIEMVKDRSYHLERSALHGILHNVVRIFQSLRRNCSWNKRERRSVAAWLHS